MERTPESSTDFFSELKRRRVFRTAIIYVVWAWVLIQVADIVLEAFDAPVWTMQGLLIFAFLGFPVVLVLAWLYDLTPEGIKPAHETDSGAGKSRFSGRKFDFVLIGLLCFALLLMIVDNYVLEREAPTSVVSRSARLKSIAVLPFQNHSATQENAAFFADGVHDDLLTLLSKLSGIRVISRTSVEKFRDSGQGLTEIANSLGVATVLEGGVQQAGNRVRINVQLIDAAADQHLWGRNL